MRYILIILIKYIQGNIGNIAMGKREVCDIFYKKDKFINQYSIDRIGKRYRRVIGKMFYEGKFVRLRKKMIFENDVKGGVGFQRSVGEGEQGVWRYIQRNSISESREGGNNRSCFLQRVYR